MTYTYRCDGWCGSFYEDRPALTGEFSEEFFTATQEAGDISAMNYDLGDLVTLCPECTHRLLVLEHDR